MSTTVSSYFGLAFFLLSNFISYRFSLISLHQFRFFSFFYILHQKYKTAWFSYFLVVVFFLLFLSKCTAAVRKRKIKGCSERN